MKQCPYFSALFQEKDSKAHGRHYHDSSFVSLRYLLYNIAINECLLKTKLFEFSTNPCLKWTYIHYIIKRNLKNKLYCAIFLFYFVEMSAGFF